MTVAQIARAPIGVLARLRERRSAGPMTASALLVVGSAGTLLFIGLIMILSSSWVSAYQQYGSSFWFFGRQLMWAAIGISAMLLVMRTDYRRFRGIGYLLLLISIGGMILVLHPAFGTRVGGSSRWLAFGPVRVQPSELAKLALVLVGADLAVRKGPRLRTVKQVLVPIGILAGLIGGLVMLQPDLGTTLILGGITFAIIYVAGARVRVLALLGASGMGAAMVLSLSEGYRRARLLSFLDPFSDPLNAGYQAVQSQIALGSGGLFGVGLGASRQKWLYVPNAHTDFIFSIIGEEVGLLGTFAVIGLFAVLTYAGIRIARRAPDAFGRIVAGGITAWIAGQAVVNMGAVTGLLPITGIPLPLVSFGGSSLVFTLIALGILINIARQEVWPPHREHAAEVATTGAAAGTAATRTARRTATRTATRTRRSPPSR